MFSVGKQWVAIALLTLIVAVTTCPDVYEHEKELRREMVREAVATGRADELRIDPWKQVRYGSLGIISVVQKVNGGAWVSVGAFGGVRVLSLDWAFSG